MSTVTVNRISAQSPHFHLISPPLQILTAGWDELECHRVFNFLWELSNLARKVQTVVSSKPGNSEQPQKPKMCRHGEGRKWLLMAANRMWVALRGFLTLLWLLWASYSEFLAFISMATAVFPSPRAERSAFASAVKRFVLRGL